MIYKTYAQIREKVENDLDLQEETFITQQELLDYCNEAIDDAEREIVGIYEDYFLTKAPLALVSGQQDYDLPAGIFAHKIRRIVYHNGTDIYTIHRLRSTSFFEDIAVMDLYPQTQDYRYIITNPDSDGPKITIYPTPTETSANNVTIWYIRNASEVAVDADKCDIPEFSSFVVQYMKVRCYEKEGHVNLPVAIQELERQRRLMITTLTNMVPDDDTTIEKDKSFYDEFS